jgi:hypothetical protein
MTRAISVIALALTLVCSIAYAQTYVRPSVGNPINPFEGQYDSGITLNTSITPIPLSATGKQYEWTAFEGARVRIDGIGGTQAQDGGTCSTLSTQFMLGSMNRVIQPQLQRTGILLNTRWKLIWYDAPVPSSNTGFLIPSYGFKQMNSPNSLVDLTSLGYLGCTVAVTVTPIPFAPPVVPTLGNLADGGSATEFFIANSSINVTASVTSSGTATSTDAGVSVTVPVCSVTQDRNSTVGITALSLPVLAGRWLTRVCNSARNTGNPIITCTSDGTTPTTALTSIGETLEPGDCAIYTTGAAVQCISDTASTAVTSWDCR